MYGAVCGYVASRILGGEGFGFIGNIVVGIIGSIVGKWFVIQFNVPLPNGAIGQLVSAVGGAIILLLFIESFKFFGPEKRSTRRKQ